MGSMHSKKEQTHSIDGQGSNSQDSVNGEGEEPASQLLDPPNGGLTAWLQVLGSFCLYFNTWSVLAAYSLQAEPQKFMGSTNLADSKQGNRQHVRRVSNLLPNRIPQLSVLF